MRIVLAYSGSLDGAAAIAWLREHEGAEVVAVTLDLGQGRELEAVRDRALSFGALRAHVLDAREVFAQEFVLPALRADALHDGRVPMALALSRPLIAQKLIDIAAIERAGAVAHTGHVTAGGSQLDRLLNTLAPALPVRAPARDWTFGGDDLAVLARTHGLAPTPGDSPRPDSNFWGRSLRHVADAEHQALGTAARGSYPAEPALLDITFTRGVPTALNGVGLPFLELVASLGTLSAMHGVGRVGARGLLCDAPAAVLLHAAHRDLTRAACADDVERFSVAATTAYIEAVEQARWFSPLRQALDAYFAEVQAVVTGHVRLRLFRGEYSTIATELSQPPARTSALRIVSSSTQQ